PNDFRLDIDSTINPVVLRAFVSPDLQQFLSDWEWPRPPTVHLAIRGDDRQPRNWRGNGTIALDRARFRGAWTNRASARVHFGDGAVTYDDLQVVRSEGTGSGSFTYDFKKHEVRIADVKTSLWPNEVIYWIDPSLAKTLAPYKFRKPPDVTLNGVYQFDGGKNTKLDFTVNGPGGMDYVFIGKTLPFDQVSAELVLTSDRLQINDLKSSLFSGKVRGNVDLSLARNDPRYRASMTVAHVDFPRLTDLYYGAATQGELKGTYDFTGRGADPRSMQGTGKLDVTNGDLFAIPIFGPLSGLLNTVFAGNLGYSMGHKANGTFTVKEGNIHTDDFEISGKLFSILGHGDIHFLDDKLDFNVRINANGAGVLLTPMYKLFEYTGEGSLKHPDWHPKRF
ncbi:MAG TPA: AsmA-like C-terminal region-containing protein, partial [Chthoniobacterales bacterium]